MEKLKRGDHLRGLCYGGKDNIARHLQGTGYDDMD
jgi:hypothetical protein